MISIGVKDKQAQRDEAGFSVYPVKHFFRCLEAATFGTDAIDSKDFEGGLNINFAINDASAAVDAGTYLIAGGVAASGVVSGGSFHEFADTEDIVIFFHHESGFTAGETFSYGNIKIGNTTGGGLNVLGKAVASPGVITKGGSAGSLAIVIKRDTGTLNVYTFDSETADATLTYSAIGFDASSHSMTGKSLNTKDDSAVPVLDAAGGVVIAGFASGELPTDSELLTELKVMNATGWAGNNNRITPNGWASNY